MQKKIFNKTEINEPFAYGMSFYKLVWCFSLGSIFGTWYEEIITFFKFGVWENRSAVIIGPFNPLYGTAYVIALLLFFRIKKPIIVIFLASIFGGAFEYAANWAQEYFTGSVSWDYSELFLNINGRTSIIYSLFWGVLIFFLVKIIYPYLSKKIEKIPHRFGVIFTRIFIVFITLNMFVTYSMLIRQGMRAKDIEPFTPLGELYDEIFSDEYIAELFPNMMLQRGDEDE